MVDTLDLGKFPERQRILPYSTRRVGPGRATRAFATMMQRMHDMDEDRIDNFKLNMHFSDCESDIGDNLVVPNTEAAPVIDEDMWEDDHPASQGLKAKAKPAPKPKASAPAKPKEKLMPPPEEKPVSKPKEITIPKTPKNPAPRGRPRKASDAIQTPADQSITDVETPRTKTPNWHVSALAQEGNE